MAFFSCIAIKYGIHLLPSNHPHQNAGGVDHLRENGMTSQGELAQISEHGYELCAVSQFLEKAPAEHVQRYRRDCAGGGQFLIWDPNDDEQGFMVACPTVAAANQAFVDQFCGCIDSLEGLSATPAE